MVTMARPLIGHQTEAYGSNPSNDKTYHFRYKVVSLDDLIPSHTDTLTVNPKYPAELQPRIRERAASREQIGNMAANLNPRVLLKDTGFLDTGPMIVGTDNVVESGNGRVLALRKAQQEYPAKYRLYKTMLENQAGSYGLSESDIARINNPILVREREPDDNRVQFAAEANQSNVLAMSPFEQAVQDAGRLPDATIQTLEVGEDESIDQALRRKANSHIVTKFAETVPANERASIVDAKGDLNPAGLTRLKLAIFTKTYKGEAGQRLARIFSESLDPTVKSIENGMFQSLPDMAKAEALVNSGARDKDLSVAPDIAEVVDVYAGLKATGMSVTDYLKQKAMFEERLTPLQRQMLDHLDGIARSPKKVREFMRDTAQRIESAPSKGQTGMFGESYAVTKEGLVHAAINKQRQENGQSAIESTVSSSPTGKGLEEPHAGRTESTSGVEAGHGTIEGPRKEAPVLAAGTQVQTGLSGFGHEAAQVTMFGEHNTAAGQGGTKNTLVDAEALKKSAENKPLAGQTAFTEEKKHVQTVTTVPETPRKKGIETVASVKRQPKAIVRVVKVPKQDHARDYVAENAAIHIWYREHPEKNRLAQAIKAKHKPISESESQISTKTQMPHSGVRISPKMPSLR